jgi:hypothetical protein
MGRLAAAGMKGQAHLTVDCMTTEITLSQQAPTPVPVSSEAT